MSRNCLKIRLFPTKAQARQLDETLETCRRVYNSLVLDREFQYETAGVSVGRYDQQAYLPVWKKDHPGLTEVYSHTLQDVVHRVDLAFKAFFRRVRAGETPGFPRFKGGGQYDSFTYTMANEYKVGDSSIHFAKIGQIKAKVHRKPWGAMSACVVRRQNGKWFACICQEVDPECLEPSGVNTSDQAVGIDVGLKTFASLSNGEFIENPRFFRKDEKALAKAQRKLSKQKRGSRERRKARKVVSRIHERIRNRRHDFCHQHARRIVNRFGVIAVEKLSVKNMMASPKAKPDPDNEGQSLPNRARAKAGLNKSIADAAWSQFRNVLVSKAENAGRKVVQVDPAYTTQDCSGCGYRAKKTLAERWHLCPMCGLSLDRDTNAAVNILAQANVSALGQKSLANALA